MNGRISGGQSAGGTLSGGGSTGGTTSKTYSHPKLTGRDAADQHPIDAITSLEAELAYRPNEAMSNLQIQAILDT